MMMMLSNNHFSCWYTSTTSCMGCTKTIYDLYDKKDIPLAKENGPIDMPELAYT